MQHLFSYLEYRDGPDDELRNTANHGAEVVEEFRLTKEKRDKLRAIARVSPDLNAMAIQMQLLGICPMQMVKSEHSEVVASLVAVGDCVSFDAKYRPGLNTQSINPEV